MLGRERFQGILWLRPLGIGKCGLLARKPFDRLRLVRGIARWYGELVENEIRAAR